MRDLVGSAIDDAGCTDADAAKGDLLTVCDDACAHECRLDSGDEQRLAAGSVRRQIGVTDRPEGLVREVVREHHRLTRSRKIAHDAVGALVEAQFEALPRRVLVPERESVALVDRTDRLEADGVVDVSGGRCRCSHEDCRRSDEQCTRESDHHL